MKRTIFQFIACALVSSAIAVAQTGAPRPNSGTVPSSAGQTSQSAPAAAPTAPAQSSQAPPSLVPENAAVITIDGVCDISPNGSTKPANHATSSAKSASSSDCKTEITRADFEKLMKTVAPGASPQARRQIASRYVQFLTAANEGVKLGVENDAEFSEQLALMRLQLLAQDAERKLQSKAAEISDTDLKSYYDQNPSAYEEITLTRLFVPHNSSDPKQAEAASEAKAIADKAREQLVAGDDPEKLQKSIYEQLKNTTTPPSTKFGARRRGTLPVAQEQKLFAMKAGEVSEVFSDPIGYSIYRVDSKEQLPFDKVKDQIKQTLVRQRINDEHEQINAAVKTNYNEAYFGPEAPTPQPPSFGRPPLPGATGRPTSPPPAGQPAPAASTARPNPK